MANAQRFRGKDSARLCVLDFAEAARIPVAKARKLIKDFGNDAETLMNAVRNSAAGTRTRSS